MVGEIYQNIVQNWKDEGIDINLSFMEFDTELDYDLLKIYDGNDHACRLFEMIITFDFTNLVLVETPNTNVLAVKLRPSE